VFNRGSKFMKRVVRLSDVVLVGWKNPFILGQSSTGGQIYTQKEEMSSKTAKMLEKIFRSLWDRLFGLTITISDRNQSECLVNRS